MNERFVSCPSCNKQVGAPLHLKTMPCPSCGKTMQLPDVPPVAQAVAAPAVESAPRTNNTGLLIVLGFVAVMFGLLGLATAGIVYVVWAPSRVEVARVEVVGDQLQPIGGQPTAGEIEPDLIPLDPPAETTPGQTAPDHTQSKPAAPAAGRDSAPKQVRPATPDKSAPTLQYGWKKGDEHVYRVEVTSEIQGKKNKIAGSCSLTINDLISATKNERQEGSGTGFVVSADGYLLTCAHVVEDAREIKVTLGEETFDAQVVDTDAQHDLALVRIERRGLVPLQLGDSEQVQLAQEVRAVGYPLSTMLGTGLKVTRGTIAGFIDNEDGRRFQVDAAINPGNSGGPIVDTRGRVVAIASAKLVGLAVTRVGFAVPCARAQQMLERNGIESLAAAPSAELAGPALAAQVSPSVALLEVSSASDAPQYAINYAVNYKDDGKTIVEKGTMRVTKSGIIEEFSGDKQLPFVIGPMAQLMVENLHNRGRSRWGTEVQSSLGILERSDDSRRSRGFPRFGGPPRPLIPFGPFGARPRQPKQPKVKEQFSAVERVRYRIDAESDDRFTLGKTYEFRTLDDMKQPYLLATGESTIVFDRQLGMPIRSDYEGSVVVHRPNVRVRIPITVSYALRAPDEVAAERRQAAEAAELAKAEAERKKKEDDEKRRIAATVPDPEKVAELIDKINRIEGHQVHWTLSPLAGLAVVPERQDEVVALFAKHAKSTDHFVREAGANGLAKWTGEKHVAVLLDAVKNAKPYSVWTSPALIRSLARFKTPEVMATLAWSLKHREYSGAARAALIETGPAAEDEVLKALAENPSMLRAVAGILKEIGTAKSIPPLERAELATNDVFTRRDVKSARETINKRVSSE